MSERKLAKLLSKSYTKLSHQFLISKGTIVKSAQKVAKYFGYFGEKKYCQNLSKIFQSGHTGLVTNPIAFHNYLIRRIEMFAQIKFFIFRNLWPSSIFVVITVWQFKWYLSSYSFHILRFIFYSKKFRNWSWFK